MKRFSKQELKIMKDNNLSLEEKANMLNRSMSSIRSKHWAIVNKPSKRPIRTTKFTKSNVDPIVIHKRVSNNSININIDSVNRKITLSY